MTGLGDLDQRAAPAASGLDQRVELDVSGMTCAACAARIEKKLNKMPGVTATVNYATERAVVLGLPPERAPEAVKTVVDAGYGATPVVEGEESSGYADRVRMLRNRLIVAAFLTVPLGDVAIVLALAPQMRFPGWEWVLLVAALPVVFWCAWPFHKAAWRNLRHGATSMDTLVSLGILAAFTWSLVAVVTGSSDASGYWVGYGIAPPGRTRCTWRWPRRSRRSCSAGGTWRRGRSAPREACCRRWAAWPRRPCAWCATVSRRSSPSAS